MYKDRTIPFSPRKADAVRRVSYREKTLSPLPCNILPNNMQHYLAVEHCTRGSFFGNKHPYIF